MEAADDICYGLIDLEDGLEMELLEYAEVEELLLALVGDDIPETYRQLGPGDSRRRKLAILRGKAIEHLTNAAAAAFVEQQNNLLRGELPGDLVEHMHGPAKACVVQAKAMARQKIFQDKRKTLHEIGAYTTLEILLNAFCGRRWNSIAAVHLHSRTSGSSICSDAAHPLPSYRSTSRFCE